MENREGAIGSRFRVGRALPAALGAVLLLFWLAGCSSSHSQSTSAGMAAKSAAANEMADSKAVANVTSNQVNSGFNTQGVNATNTAEPFSRKIIYTALLTMQVDDYQKRQAEVQAAVLQSGGYILQSSETGSPTEKSGTLTVKVPASGFQSLLDRLGQIQPVLQKNVQGQDVTEEYVDLDSRLKAKQVAESRLLSFMEKATKAEDLVAFSNELNKVQQEMEQIKGRMRYLEQNTAFSTIELRMTQRIGSADAIGAVDRGPLLDRAYSALRGSYAVLLLALQWLVVVLAGAVPVLLLAAVVGGPIWFYRKAYGRRKSLEKQLPTEDLAVAEAPPEPITPDNKQE